MTEKVLFRAFDLQRFARSERLQAVIDSVHQRHGGLELDDEALDLVSAAGQPIPQTKSEEKNR